MANERLLLQNCVIFDGHSEDLLEGAEIVIEGERIREINRVSTGGKGGHKIDVAGRFVMPGLIDAHFHAYGADWNVHRVDHMHAGWRALFARRHLEEAAQRGFTSVRDAGGGDHVLVRATAEGLIAGPRIFPAGLALSQTGGHGDFRPPYEQSPCQCSGYQGFLSQVTDGPEEVRRAAREQLRKGATQIKLFLSGGVLSPSDPIWMSGFTDDEIRAAVEEAARHRTYVMAHCHTEDAALRCLRLGVRSIEHGSILSEAAVQQIKASDAFVVPTLSPVWVVENDAAGFGVSGEKLAKAQEVGRHCSASFEMLMRAGAQVGFGTDLFGKHTHYQSNEFAIRKPLAAALGILRSATSVNAKLLGKEKELGAIAPGALADVIVVDGDPLRDVAVLAEAKRIGVVIRDGQILRNTLG